MGFTLQVLGTASAVPNSVLNPSSQVLTVRGRLFMIDCGEGTQQMMRRMHLSFLKVEAIFISHVHGDHVFGLPGVLSTMTLYGRSEPLHVFGPEALGGILDFYKSNFGERASYEIVFHRVQAESMEKVYLSHSGYLEVSAFPLNHRIECYGYRFDERISERSAMKRSAVSYAYCSDTAPFPQLPFYVSGVDVLYHEATYPAELKDKAAQYFHSTTHDAAMTALLASAGRLLIGHYSSRISDFEALRAECLAAFPNTTAVMDGDVIEIEGKRPEDENLG